MSRIILTACSVAQLPLGNMGHAPPWLNKSQYSLAPKRITVDKSASALSVLSTPLGGVWCLPPQEPRHPPGRPFAYTPPSGCIMHAMNTFM